MGRRHRLIGWVSPGKAVIIRAPHTGPASAALTHLRIFTPLSEISKHERSTGKNGFNNSWSGAWADNRRRIKDAAKSTLRRLRVLKSVSMVARKGFAYEQTGTRYIDP